MQINMLDAKSKLSSLVAAVERGEEVILARDGMPVAKIVKYVRPKVKAPGAWKGLLRVSTDWNSAETNALVESLFYGEKPFPQGASGTPEQVAEQGPRRKPAHKAPSKASAQGARKSASRSSGQR